MEDVALLAYKEHRKTTATLLFFFSQNGRAFKIAFMLGPGELLNFVIYPDFLVLLKPVKLVTFWATISIHMSKDETISVSQQWKRRDT